MRHRHDAAGRDAQPGLPPEVVESRRRSPGHEGGAEGAERAQSVAEGFILRIARSDHGSRVRTDAVRPAPRKHDDRFVVRVSNAADLAALSRRGARWGRRVGFGPHGANPAARAVNAASLVGHRAMPEHQAGSRRRSKPARPPWLVRREETGKCVAVIDWNWNRLVDVNARERAAVPVGAGMSRNGAARTEESSRCPNGW